MLPDFNKLKIFYHIYKNNSGAAAAKELNISQSAVSQHLGHLETEMKTRLFTRVHKRLVPTPAAEKLYSILHPFVAELENGIREIHQAQKGPFGLLRIGAPVGFGENFLPAVFASFIKLHPAVSFALELGHPTVLLPQLTDGTLDFAFVDIFSSQGRFTKDLSPFSVSLVAKEELLLICSNSYYRVNLKERVDFESLSNCRYVAYRRHTPALVHWFRHHFNKQTVRLDVSLTAESVRTVINSIKQDMGLGVVPAYFVRKEIEAGELMAIRTRKKEIINQISLVRLQDKIPGPTEKIFLQHFTKEIASFLPGDRF